MSDGVMCRLCRRMMMIGRATDLADGRRKYRDRRRRHLDLHRWRVALASGDLTSSGRCEQPPSRFGQ